MTVSVPDCFGHRTEMVTLITVLVLHDCCFGPAINCSHHLSLIIVVGMEGNINKDFIILQQFIYKLKVTVTDSVHLKYPQLK